MRVLLGPLPLILGISVLLEVRLSDRPVNYLLGRARVTVLAIIVYFNSLLALPACPALVYPAMLLSVGVTLRKLVLGVLIPVGEWVFTTLRPQVVGNLFVVSDCLTRRKLHVHDY